MKNLSELKDEIINFWEIEENAKKDQLIKQIQEYSNSIEAGIFIKEVRENFEQINFSGISVIYEALSDTPEKWYQFFYEEYERAFKTAERSNDSFEILECLEEIGFTEYNRMKNKDEIIQLLSTYLSSPNEVLRYKSVWIIGDCITKDTCTKYSHVVSKLKDRLNDDNWKIRFITRGLLKNMEQLPKGYSVNFIDRLREKFLNPYTI